MAKKRWIQDAIKKPGALTDQAKKRGMTVVQFSRTVKGNPDHYSTVTKKRVNLANTLRKMK